VGFDSPAHLGLGCGEGAGRREPAAAAMMECGGGAAGPGKEMGAAVGIGCEARGPFIADVGRLGGAVVGGRGVVTQRAPRTPLMAVGGLIRGAQGRQDRSAAAGGASATVARGVGWAPVRGAKRRERRGGGLAVAQAASGAAAGPAAWSTRGTGVRVNGGQPSGARHGACAAGERRGVAQHAERRAARR